MVAKGDVGLLKWRKRTEAGSMWRPMEGKSISNLDPRNTCNE